MKRIVYIISDIEKALAFEWVSEHLEPTKFELSFILLNSKDSELERLLRQRHSVWRIDHAGKTGLLSALLKTMKILRNTRPDSIHCHMRKANFIGLAAGYITRIRQRIYTRHSSTFNHAYFPHAVKYDKLANKLATRIVAISENVQKVLEEKECVEKDKVRLIRHGFDLESFRNVPPERIATVRAKYGIPEQGVVIGVISRLLELKGIQYIIPAVKQLLDDGEQVTLVMANARGSYQGEVQKLLNTIPEESYRLIPFESDLQALFKCFDFYIHVPINETIEAFGQTYIEALASGIPSVFTLSGVAPEFIQHEKNALVVPFKNSEEIHTALSRLISEPELCSALSYNGLESIQGFSLRKFIQNLEDLYEE